MSQINVDERKRRTMQLQTAISPQTNIQHKAKLPFQIRLVNVRKADEELVLLDAFHNTPKSMFAGFQFG
jgi:hypothetical protein